MSAPATSPAPPADEAPERAIIRRIAELLCYENCRAGICKDAEHCCGGSQSPRVGLEQAAALLLAPLKSGPAPDTQGRADDRMAVCTKDARAFELDRAYFKIADLERQLAEAREMIRFYADNNNYFRLQAPAIDDAGSRARAWLQSTGGEK